MPNKYIHIILRYKLFLLPTQTYIAFPWIDVGRQINIKFTLSLVLCLIKNLLHLLRLRQTNINEHKEDKRLIGSSIKQV